LYTQRYVLAVEKQGVAVELRLCSARRGQRLECSDRLLQEGERPRADRIRGIRRASLPCQDDDRPTTPCAAQLLHEVEAAHAGHGEIHEDAAGSKLWIGIEKRLPLNEGLGMQAAVPQEELEPPDEPRIVVHDIHHR